MKILSIDTSNQTLAIGVMDDQRVLGQIQTTINKNHSVTLMPAVELLVQKVGLKPKDFDRIVVAQGPGSYTGLRIGVTAAKTLADTLKIELVGISSLKTIAANCIGRSEWIVPIFNARRQNVYAGAYEWQAGVLVNVLPDQHLSLENLLEKLAGRAVYFVGEDVEVFREAILVDFPETAINQNPAWNYPNGITLAALGAKEQPVDNIHDFLPEYLKLVEAEENWLATQTQQAGVESYVEKV
ncbi:tRNA (adenosine(37)-N6)-threonylcarbamoyltransferase complex dimerization subunit type 1 TsaB [Enterococcus alcedinis]|uniref:tRNA (Adenosine(37)-N6)-threonylcarbamoyltransferase complex dimerization subunit type 1 TsaB n=1 Tax=Enterococcus alcedinis TaxID=1274384 RepID=A0A917JEY1_9ENTE|nr:tRNA (adenosine(37)-N6)-threonylcarbamoyltransferase complex dimerization subunit type 1 TsaB [Enterococcus alcedinis]MBP2102501.1 tRNA threonylcarbamoyl adenosine modification protein YeaZ [Enterococcus alcedinis]GGI65963.1 tRNA (adenosine(37)-N6)-threonylcarbamoyltransferase complex dimerization subunit type 1 TsaB [Enterococcus alcedinis]